MSVHRSGASALFLVLGLALMMRMPLRAGGDQRQALIDLEEHWLEVEDDPASLEAVLAYDFVHVLPNGFTSKAEQLAWMRSHPRKGPSIKRFEDLKVRIYGDAGIANGVVVATMPDGKLRKTIFTDVFVYRNGKWQAVNAQEAPFEEHAHR
jgi:hypothetical protein